MNKPCSGFTPSFGPPTDKPFEVTMDCECPAALPDGCCRSVDGQLVMTFPDGSARVVVLGPDGYRVDGVPAEAFQVADVPAVVEGER